MEETIGSSAPILDGTDNQLAIPTEHGSDAPTVADESLIPEGKEPEVFDAPTGMNMPGSLDDFLKG